MLTNRGLLILFVVTAVCIAAAVVSRQPAVDVSLSTRGPYFPDLLAQSNRVANIVVSSNGNVTTITKTGDKWRIAEIGGYLAATDKVRELVLGMARLQRVEAKTKNPDLYGRLELDGVDAPGSTSSQVQLMDDAGRSLAVLIIGKRKSGQAGGSRQRIYVRSPDDAQAWQVEGLLPVLDDAAVGWVERALMTPGVGAVRSVSVNRDGDAVTVSRPDADAKDFVLENLGTDETIESQYTINQIVQSFKDLRMEDVKPASAAASDTGAYAEVELESFAGVRINLSLSRQGDRYLGRMRAEQAQPGATEESLAAKVKQWNDLWQDWIYILPDYQVGAIVVSKQDLIQTRE